MATEVDSVSEILRNMQAYAGKLQEPATGAADEKFAAAHKIAFNVQENPLTGDSNYNTVVSLADSLKKQRETTEHIRRVADAAKFTGVDSIIANTAAQMSAAFQDAVVASEKIGAIESQGFLDNPIGWIANQLMPDPAYAEYEAAASRFNLLSQGVVAQSNTLQEVTTTLNATKEAQSVAAEKSMVEALRSKVALANMELQKQAHDTNAEALTILWNATEQQSRIYEASQRLAMARSSLELRSDKAAMEDWAKQSEDRLLETIQLGYLSFHGKPMPPLDINDFKLMLKTGQNMRSEHAKYIQRGQQMVDTDPNDPLFSAFGYTPAEALANISLLRIQLPNAAKRTLDDILAPAMQTAVTTPEYKGAKDQATRDAIVNSHVAGLLKQRAQEMDDRDGSNPLLMLPLKTYNDESVTGAQIVKNTNLWKKVFAEDVKAGKYNKLDHNQIFTATAKAVADKKLTALEAANDLTTIVAFSKRVNSVVRQFSRFGIEAPADYMVKIDFGGVGGLRATQAAVIPGIAGGISSVAADILVPDTNVELVNLANTNSVLSAIQKFNANLIVRTFQSVPTERGKGKGELPK